jgi:hypothetical protein
MGQLEERCSGGEAVLAPADVWFAVLSRLEDPGPALVALHRHVRGGLAEFQHLWFRRQAAAHRPRSPWPYAALSPGAAAAARRRRQPAQVPLALFSRVDVRISL